MKCRNLFNCVWQKKGTLRSVAIIYTRSHTYISEYENTGETLPYNAYIEVGLILGSIIAPFEI